MIRLKGFTLLEMMLVTALTVIVFGLGFQALLFLNKNFKQAVEISYSSQDLSILEKTIATDLFHAKMVKSNNTSLYMEDDKGLIIQYTNSVDGIVRKKRKHATSFNQIHFQSIIEVQQPSSSNFKIRLDNNKKAIKMLSFDKHYGTLDTYGD